MHPSTLRKVLAVLVIVTFAAIVREGVLESAAPAAAVAQGREQAASVLDGVFTMDQAARGKVVYQERCARCHSRGAAPLLVGEAFLRRWFEDPLAEPFAKILNTMPENAPGTLPEAAVADVLSFLLESSGYPAGAQELRSDPDLLSRVLIVGKDGPGGAVPNFSLVQVLGCLAQAADNAWMLTNGTDPVRSREPGASKAEELKAAASKPLGSHSFRLLDFTAVGQESFKGQKVEVKGFLIRRANDDRLNVTAVHSFGESCTS
jgi:mono/diheme cytochrome c family protein